LCFFVALALSTSFFFCPYHSSSFSLLSTLSLHDALPIFLAFPSFPYASFTSFTIFCAPSAIVAAGSIANPDSLRISLPLSTFVRSEEHTSELQSRFDLVCRLLLEKKQNILVTKIYSA